MKKIIYLACFLLPIACIAQKQGNIWHFGLSAGLDFNSGVPVFITGGMTGSAATGGVGHLQEGSSCISDSSGKLLFYCDGLSIYNRFHKIMPNGSNLYGDKSSTQEGIIVPKPGSNTLFYVFTNSAAFEVSKSGYRYNVVDMCLDSNRGNVISGQKNILLLDTATEKIAACADIQDGYWIMGHKNLSNEFSAWRLTTSGIASPVMSRIGAVFNNTTNGASFGQMKFNHQGTKLAVTLGTSFEIFDFDRSTGLLSNMCHITLDTISAFGGGIEFSPDGSKLYTSVNRLNPDYKRFDQFDMQAGGGNCDSIKASRQTLFTTHVNNNGNLVFWGMQCGPDGKIYVCTRWNPGTIGRINFPNLSGTSAGFDSAAIILPNVNAEEFPSFIAGYKYHNGIISCPKPTSAGVEPYMDDYVNFYPNPVEGVATLNIGPSVDIEGMQIAIQDAYGKIMSSITVSSHKMSIDMSQVPNGIYFYHLRHNGQLVKVGKLIVQ